MKKSYLQPEIWVEELAFEGNIAQQVSKIESQTGISYGGGGSGPAFAGDNPLWDDEDEDEDNQWDHL